VYIIVGWVKVMGSNKINICPGQELCVHYCGLGKGDGKEQNKYFSRSGSKFCMCVIVHWVSVIGRKRRHIIVRMAGD